MSHPSRHTVQWTEAPRDHWEATQHANAPQFQEAMEKEMESQQDCGTSKPVTSHDGTQHATVTLEQAARTTTVTFTLTALTLMAIVLPMLWPDQSHAVVTNAVGDAGVNCFSAVVASLATVLAASGVIAWAAAPVIAMPWLCLTVDKCYETVRVWGTHTMACATSAVSY
jgi:hypothetical protein